MEKKNTIVLTVIAIATLLVAVVGATFAYFAVGYNNNADVKTTVTTSAAADAFTATGTGSLALTIDNNNMSNNATYTSGYAVAAEASSSDLKVSLKAGSGTATCTYDLQLVKNNGSATYAKTSGVTGNEFTIQGTDGTQSFSEINVDTAVAKAGTTTGTDEQGNAVQTTGILGNYTITAGTTEVTQTWTIKSVFYNVQAVNQATEGILGKTFDYSVKVVNVKCSNSNS